ncbi:VirK/YbjX family protein [Photobacterium sp. SDRW27]|uniref:VirK/YbjX family protein n=1 Tax=Photobacterium obscurum TaxID=2829490 RepID=UPI0022440A36|nr:VirK/YbjX family protein [Photobacterium obscurum]MCW8328891.1 VirK/YbjX family protein [Photobacterium obscurum]
MNSTTTHSDYIRALPALANTIYPNSKGFRKIKKNARFCMWGIVNAKAIKAITNIFSDPVLLPIIKQNPNIIEKPLKPYLCVNWKKEEKLEHICNHFLFLKDTFGHHTSTIFSPFGLTIFEFQDSQKKTYKVQLFRGESREGSLGLKLIDDQNRNIYSLTCHISAGKKKELYIGALQGPSESISDRQQVIKTLTRSIHGLRTKALMTELTLIMARVLEIDEIYAISNKGHIYQALRYIGSKRNSITFDYDDLWSEYGATKINKYFYQLPINPARKDPATLKKTKRRLYTKRYQWLDGAEQSITDRIKAVTQTQKSGLK